MPSPTPHIEPRAMPVPDLLHDLRSEMAVWAEPVIADTVSDGYADRSLGSASHALLSIHHRRLWRALILDQRGTAERIWLDLERDLQRAGLDPDVTEEINAAVLDELMDIVFCRFSSSRHKARGFGRVLLGAAAQTVAVRPLHA
ncbi:hypothetical protein P7D22_15155 [Lichenihabitans sp. Uapishka_5]|uniref:hypothetical protein n=1 Tax=Lichenihabitans sp. Uapishka_5 TaxID=3037302 RepID=UPI0029E8191D|nr:hypothetical protein [Lichenihabitans sp. Uapishka_5]MDX7952506.1 hypothetical protein [Lichenihabitans sp. Uapishka_5]